MIVINVLFKDELVTVTVKKSKRLSSKNVCFSLYIDKTDVLYVQSKCRRSFTGGGKTVAPLIFS